ncbi:MaoC family dehydratase [Campylobacter concisus]|uniref:MaoC family dehydratase n=1 Tax=Campylobacter concisus TaxID=199 RepID=UPI000CD8D912|nr:MaoC family dehydratase [Campylobacter concisus]
MKTKTIPIDEIEIGMSESLEYVVTDENIFKFAQISGDSNPIHLDEEYAKSTRYKKRIAHGMMSASLFSSIFGTRLPGVGCVYVSQNIRFLKPVYISDLVRVTVKVIGIDQIKRRVFFRTSCFVGNKMVIDGEAEIYIP